MKIIEYKTVHVSCSAVGVEKAMIPVSPKGFGWMLLSFIYINNEFWYLSWRINPFQKRHKEQE